MFENQGVSNGRRSLGKMKKGLEMDDADGCTAMQMCLMPQNLHSKVVQIVTFFHNRKKNV